MRKFIVKTIEYWQKNNVDVWAYIKECLKELWVDFSPWIYAILIMGTMLILMNGAIDGAQI